MRQEYETWFRKKHRSVRAFYRWMKLYYLPALDRRIDKLPDRVASLANKVDKKHTSFYVL